MIRCHSAVMTAESTILEPQTLGSLKGDAWYIQPNQWEPEASSRSWARYVLTKQHADKRLIDVCVLIIDDLVAHANKPCSVHVVADPTTVMISVHHRGWRLQCARTKHLVGIYNGRTWAVADPDGKGESMIVRFRVQ